MKNEEVEQLFGARLVGEVPNTGGGPFGMARLADLLQQHLTTDFSTMKQYNFSFVLSGVTELTDELACRIHAAGCDDATLSQRSGRVYVHFTREADSQIEAIHSARQNVNEAGYDVDVIVGYPEE